MRTSHYVFYIVICIVLFDSRQHIVRDILNFETREIYRTFRHVTYHWNFYK